MSALPARQGCTLQGVPVGAANKLEKRGGGELDTRRGLSASRSARVLSDQVVVGRPLRGLPDEVARVEATHERGKLELVA